MDPECIPLTKRVVIGSLMLGGLVFRGFLSHPYGNPIYYRSRIEQPLLPLSKGTRKGCPYIQQPSRAKGTIKEAPSSTFLDPSGGLGISRPEP